MALVKKRVASVIIVRAVFQAVAKRGKGINRKSGDAISGVRQWTEIEFVPSFGFPFSTRSLWYLTPWYVSGDNNLDILIVFTRHTNARGSDSTTLLLSIITIVIIIIIYSRLPARKAAVPLGILIVDNVHNDRGLSIMQILSMD